MVDFAKLLRDGPPPPPKVPGLIVGVTGHRPDKLFSSPELRDGYDLNSYLRRVAWKGPMPDVVGVSGGALGIDQDACGVWYRMGVAYLLMLPFPGQEARWPRELQAVYRQLLDKAAGVIYVSEKAPKTDEEAAEMLKRRNEWVCGPSDELLAVWDGSRGGTMNCVNFWRRCDRSEILIDPRELR